MFTALQAWLSPHDAVVPEEELFGTGQTQQQVTRQDTAQMVGSQQLAEAAALCQLNIPFKVLDTVTLVYPKTPAAGVLKKGDIITAVDGKPLTCRANAGTLIRARKPGDPVRLTVDRHGTTRQFRLKTANVKGKAVVGVGVFENYQFPFQVKIDVGNIGGPSAGLMFALGIMDKLSPEQPDRRPVHRRYRGDLRHRAGQPDRGNPAENGRRPRGWRDRLPDPGGQLPGHPRSRSARAAPDQGVQPGRRGARSARAQDRRQCAVLLAAPRCLPVPPRGPGMTFRVNVQQAFRNEFQ